jgi:hypothetical protein
MAYWNLGNEPELASQTHHRALELRAESLSAEKLLITSSYYTITDDLDKGIETLEVWRQTYPRTLLLGINLALHIYALARTKKPLRKRAKAFASIRTLLCYTAT